MGTNTHTAHQLLKKKSMTRSSEVKQPPCPPLVRRESYKKKKNSHFRKRRHTDQLSETKCVSLTGSVFFEQLSDRKSNLTTGFPSCPCGYSTCLHVGGTETFLKKIQSPRKMCRDEPLVEVRSRYRHQHVAPPPDTTLSLSATICSPSCLCQRMKQKRQVMAEAYLQHCGDKL